MVHPREEILARLHSTIVGWKAEVQASHEGLSAQIATANSQLSRLLEVLSARNELAIALAAARHEIEMLRGLAVQHNLSLPEEGQASMEVVRQDMLATFGRLAEVVGRWTVEVTGAQHGLMLQIDKANAQFDALLSILQAGADRPAPSEADRAREEYVRQQEAELESLREENRALLLEAKRFGERADHLRKVVEERMAQAEVVRVRCAKLEAEAEGLRQALQDKDASTRMENLAADEERAGYVRQAEECVARAQAAEQARTHSDSELAVLRAEIDKARQELVESRERVALLESEKVSQEATAAQISEAAEREWRERVAKAEVEADRCRVEAEDARAALELSKTHVAALKDTLLELEGRHQEAGEKTNGLEEDLAAVKTRLEESEQRAARSEEELSGLRMTVENLKSRESQHEEDRNQAAAELASLETAKQALEGQLSEVRGALASREEDEIRLRSEIELLRIANDELKEQLSEARAGLESREEDGARLRGDFESLQSAKQELDAQLLAMRAALRAQEEDASQIRGAHELLLEEKQALEAQLSEARATLAERESQLRGDYESLQGTRQDLEVELSTAHAALTAHEEEESRLQSEIDSLQGAKQDLEAQLAKALAALGELREAEHSLRENYEMLQGEKCGLEEQLSRTQAALDERDRRLSDRENNIDALQNYVSELEGEAEQLRDRVQESVSAVDELRGTLDAMVSTDMSRVAEIENNQRAIEGLKRDLAEHANVVDLLTKRRTELEGAVAAFSEREEEARARLQVIEEQFERNSAEVHAREDLIAELERTLDETRSAAQAEKEKLEEKLAETLGTMDAVLNASDSEATPPPSRVFVGSAGMGTDPAAEAARIEAESQCQRIVISERVHDGEAGRKLGRILADAGVLTETQVETALKEQARSGELLGAVLARLEWASEEAIAQALSCQLGLPVVRPKEEVVEADAAALFYRDVCLWHVFVPLRISGGKIVMAMANPLDETACKKAADLSRKEVAPVLATSSAIMMAIDDIYGIL